MYNRIHEKIKENVFPFHQKVLRFNYDIPIESLKIALSIVFKHFDSRELCIAPDFFEYSNQIVCSYQVMQKDKFLERLQDCSYPNEMEKMGIFNGELSYYIRLYIENEKDISEGFSQTGNFEIYAKDSDIQLLYDKIQKEVAAHIILDGAKKYLDEIFYY